MKTKLSLVVRCPTEILIDHTKKELLTTEITESSSSRCKISMAPIRFPVTHRTDMSTLIIHREATTLDIVGIAVETTLVAEALATISLTLTITGGMTSRTQVAWARTSTILVVAIKEIWARTSPAMAPTVAIISNMTKISRKT